MEIFATDSYKFDINSLSVHIQRFSNLISVSNSVTVVEILITISLHGHETDYNDEDEEKQKETTWRDNNKPNFLK